MVVRSWTGVFLGKVDPFTAISAPISALVNILAPSFESLIYRSIGSWTRVGVLMNVQVSRSPRHFVLLSSLPETVFLSRLGWRNLVLTRAKVPIVLDFLSLCLLQLSIPLILLVLLLLFPFVYDVSREICWKFFV